MSTPAASIPAPLPTADLIPESECFVSEQEYWDHYYESEIAYEWNNGRLEEKPVSDHLTFLAYLWFLALLEHFLKVHPIAHIIGLEMGFRMRLPRKTVIRKLDLGVVRHDNPVPIKPLDRSFLGICDLCIEALSDSTPQEARRDTVTKKGEYGLGGVAEYYILHHEVDRCAFYGRNAAGIYMPLPILDEAIHSQVLPGFRFRPGDLILRPDAEALLKDEVYRDFVLPVWQEDKRRAETEARRAEIEAQARQEAEQRTQAAEAEVARLRRLLGQW